MHIVAGCCFTTAGASTLQKPLENITLVIKRILLLRFVEQDTSLMCSCKPRFGQNTGGNDGKQCSTKQGADFVHAEFAN
jgi:hypothetical protein